MRRTTHFYLMVSSVCLILLKGVLPDNTAANNSPETSTAVNLNGLSYYMKFDKNLCLNDLDDYNATRQEVISIGKDTNKTQSQDSPVEPQRPHFVKEITSSSPCNPESTSDAIYLNVGNSRQNKINGQSQEIRNLYLESNNDIRKVNAREIMQKRFTDNRRCSVLRSRENRRTDQRLTVNRLPYTEKRNKRLRVDVVSERRTNGFMTRDDVISKRRTDRHVTRDGVVSMIRTDRLVTRDGVVSERRTDGYMARDDVISERRTDRHMTRDDVVSKRRTDRHMTRNDVIAERHTDRYMTRDEVVTKRRTDRSMTRDEVVSNRRTDEYMRHSIASPKTERTQRRNELPSNRREISRRRTDFNSERRHRTEDREGKVSSESRSVIRREIQPRMIVHSREDHTYHRYEARSIDNAGRINRKRLENTSRAERRDGTGNNRRRESSGQREAVVLSGVSESFYTQQLNRNLPSLQHTTYTRTNIRRNEINENTGSQRIENRGNAQTGSDFEYIKPAEQRNNRDRRRTENISVLKRAPLYIQTSWFMEEVGVARAIFIGFIGIMGRKLWQKQI